MAFNLDRLVSSASVSRLGRRKSHSVSFADTSWGKRGFASALDQFGIVSITDPGGRILHVNDEFIRLSGYSRDELIGRTHAILNSSHHPKTFWAEAYRTLAGGKTWRAQVRNRGKSGRAYWVDALIVPLNSRNGLKGFLSVQRDITEVVALRAESEERASILQTIVESFPGGITAFDKDHNVVLCNRRQRELMHYPDELFANGQPTAEDLYRVEANRGEYGPGDAEEHVRKQLDIASRAIPQTIERRRPNGTYLETRYIPLAHGGFVTTQLDITGRKLDQETIGRLVHHDALTGLPNRSLFLDRMRSSIAGRGQELLALHCLNLDNLKLVNESLGDLAGDELLKRTAQRLSRLLGDSDTAARLGGDDFAVIQAAPKSINDVEAMAKRIISMLSESIGLDGRDITIGTSVGVAVAPTDGTHAVELIRNADAALRRTKSLARGTYGFFEPSMHERLRQRLRMEMEMREALASNAFELHYQPIVNTKTLKIVGCEALIRWRHPERGLVPASEFIPIAEECGIIGQIGDWVLKTACAEASRWPDDVWIAVNISAAQFSGPSLVDKVLAVSKGLPLSQLVLEITETLLMKNRDIAAATLDRLKKLGVRFAIDDFGTGFSSLSYLQSFPFDKIKIDRSFVSNIANQKRSATLRRSIIQLGYNLGMTSVAEGVESKQQLDLLRAEGCVEAQGFLFSPAVPSAKIRELFASPL
ncbi:Diguanylate cyclase [Hyphomicrobium denitrificans 1NES1]|uniref:Diguanylate cyclase n=1 Tax=Hyphomicrobium denitrificans 1NES1 TaxID=670307 RepID=N0B8L9_9HYPH|nr:EAL domain-containing protein [Hyphomicrobium denitrificans]AGK59378.1 Diguanylate cyclase [Hyphomicrobium denitrificans 1NES1]